MQALVKHSAPAQRTVSLHIYCPVLKQQHALQHYNITSLSALVLMQRKFLSSWVVGLEPHMHLAKDQFVCTFNDITA